METYALAYLGWAYIFYAANHKYEYQSIQGGSAGSVAGTYIGLLILVMVLYLLIRLVSYLFWKRANTMEPPPTVKVVANVVNTVEPLV